MLPLWHETPLLFHRLSLQALTRIYYFLLNSSAAFTNSLRRPPPALFSTAIFPAIAPGHLIEATTKEGKRPLNVYLFYAVNWRVESIPAHREPLLDR